MPLALRAALLALATTAAGAAAQAVEGTVRASDYDRPLGGARVVLLDGDLTPNDSTLTDPGGRFVLSAQEPGDHVLIVGLEGHLTVSHPVRLAAGETAAALIEMPVISAAASRIMGDAIRREQRFQVPLEELCREPLRPWEAGVLVGMTRELPEMAPRAGVILILEPLDDGGEPVRTGVSTESGAFWFCNVPAGRARLVARGDGLRADTSVTVIRAGTVSWYDALLRRDP